MLNLAPTAPHSGVPGRIEYLYEAGTEAERPSALCESFGSLLSRPLLIDAASSSSIDEGGEREVEVDELEVTEAVDCENELRNLRNEVRVFLWALVALLLLLLLVLVLLLRAVVDAVGKGVSLVERLEKSVLTKVGTISKAIGDGGGVPLGHVRYTIQT